MTDLASRPLPAGALRSTSSLFDDDWAQLQRRSTEAGDFTVLAGRDGASRDGVAVLVRHGDRLLLIRERRWAIAREVVQLPGGGADAGEDVEVAGRRELREETGCDVLGRAVRLGPLWRSVAEVGQTSLLFIDAVEVALTGEPDGEVQEVLWAPVEDVVRACELGVISCSHTVAAVLRARVRGLI